MEERRKIYSNRAASIQKKEENESVILNKSNIGQSGNSDVDVNVSIEIETISIAYAMLCSLWAKNQMTDYEFNRAIKKLEELRTKKTENSDDEVVEVEKTEERRGRRNNIFNNKGLFRL